MAARTRGGSQGARLLLGCAVMLAVAVLAGALLIRGGRPARQRVGPPAVPPVLQRVSPAGGGASIATPPRPTGPLTLDEETIGVTSEAGYDYPDGNAGGVICNREQKAICVNPLARAPQRIGSAWILVSAPGCPRPFWSSSVSWLQGEPLDLPTATRLPALRWPEPSALPSIEKARGQVSPSFGEGQAGQSAPGAAGTRVCVIAKGAEVRALARVAAGGLDALVRTPACPTAVWIDMTAVKWTGLEWWQLADRLPAVRPGLSGPLPVPEIATARPTTAAVTPTVRPGAPTRVFVRDTRGRAHPWHQSLPEAWRARSAEEATLLATVRRTPEVVERCSYIPQGLVYRLRPGYSITLSLADPTRVVARTSLLGEKPAGCPASVSVTIGGGGGGSSPWEIGAEPKPEALNGWLAPFVRGSR